MPYITAVDHRAVAASWSSRTSRPSTRRARPARRKLDAVHALPHDRARASCSRRRSSPWPAAASCCRPPRLLSASSSLTNDVLGRDPAHGHHDDRRHRPHHVDGRARSPSAASATACRSLIFTSIAAAFPSPSMWRSGRRSGVEVLLRRDRGRHRRSSRGGLRRAVAAPHPGAVRQAHGRPPHVRRQPTRTSRSRSTWRASCPVIFASSLLYLPRPDRAVQPARRTATAPGGSAGSVQLPDKRRPPALHGAVLPADRRVHLLLRRDHLQPGRGRRQHEEVRRLHPRHPRGSSDRRVPRLRAHARVTLPGSLYLGLIALHRRSIALAC